MNEQNIKDSEKSILQLRKALKKNLEAVDQEITQNLIGFTGLILSLMVARQIIGYLFLAV